MYSSSDNTKFIFFLKLISLLITSNVKVISGSEERVNLVVVGSGIINLDNDNHTMYCEFAEDSPCMFMDPAGRKLFVEGDVVVDEESNVVSGMYGYTGGRPGTCGIILKPLLESHLGNYICVGEVEQEQLSGGIIEMGELGLQQFEGGRLGVAGHLNLRTQGLVPDVRLPQHLLPIKYTVKIIPRLEPDLLVTEGYVSLWLGSNLNDSSTSSDIVVHMEDMYIFPSSVHVWWCSGPSSCQIITVDRLGFDYERKLLVVSTSALGFEDWGRVKLDMSFRGNLRQDGMGFYSGSYTEKDGTNKQFAATQFEADGARRAFPCMDEPAMKATFQVSLGRPGHMSALSNMPEFTNGSNVPIPGLDNYFWSHFEESVPMSSYLVAFLVSELDCVVSGSTRVWARPAAVQNGKADYALQVAGQILNFYSHLFGVDYPLPKMDLVALPGKGGAMENWGLVLFGEEALLYDPVLASKETLWRVSSVLAHELAHQWFGNLVTLSWWNELWLNEGFAQFVSYLGVEHLGPSLGEAWHFFIKDELQTVLELDAYNTTHPINVPISDPAEIGKVFDSISYSKGASVIRMMKFFLGNETFLRGIHNYLEELEFGNAVQEDLWRHLTVAGHQDGTLDKELTTKLIMDTWTMQAGYPVLVAERTYGRQSKLRVRQLKFSWDGAEDVEYEGWYIPYTYTSIDNDQGRCKVDQTTRYTWLPPAGVDGYYGWMSTCDDSAFIFNLDQLGFYRVLYDQRNYQLIGNQLNRNHTAVQPINRAQIVDDAMAMAKSGLIPYTTALDLTLYMSLETDYLPLHTIRTNFQLLSDLLVYSPGYSSFITYLHQLLDPLFQGIEVAPDLPIMDNFYSVDLISWACSVGLDNCVNQVMASFSVWENTGGDTPFHPDVEETAYCTAVGAGEEKEFTFLLNLFLESDDVNQRTSILRGLACSKQSWLLIKVLNLIVDPSVAVSDSDGYYLARAVASNVAGRFVAMEWVVNNYAQIMSSSHYTVPGVLEGFAVHGSSSLDLELLEWFKEQHGPGRTLNNALDKVAANIRWMDKYKDTVLTWMQQHTS